MVPKPHNPSKIPNLFLLKSVTQIWAGSIYLPVCLSVYLKGNIILEVV